jgi:RNA-directed DNA polymerase
LHYALDKWLELHYDVEYERFADDVIIHCKTEEEAEEIKRELTLRMQECGLELHPEKTKIVYCKDDSRRDEYP